jgi:hypothetical protein
MEKRRPTYDLDAVKEALGSIATLAMTTTALPNAAALGSSRHGVGGSDRLDGTAHVREVDDDFR